MPWILLIVLLIVFAGGGYWGGPHVGPWSWSPLGILVVVLVVLVLTGRLRL